MNRIEVFGIDLFLGFAAVGAALSLGLWVYVMVRIRPSLIHGALHSATVLLASGTFVSLDVVLLAGLTLRPDPLLFRMAVAFVMGMQATAAISALLMLRQIQRRERGG